MSLTTDLLHALYSKGRLDAWFFKQYSVEYKLWAPDSPLFIIIMDS